MTQQGPAATARNDRKQEAASWAADILATDRVQLRPVSADASFRRYFRFDLNAGTVILMDAPPAKENSAPFIDVASRLRKAGLRAPEIYAFDLESGFGLLEDFGDTLYREIIDEASMDELFPELLAVLEAMAGGVDTDGLPDYDAMMLRKEMNLFRDWYLDRHRNRRLADSERMLWEDACTRLIDCAQAQRQVFVHKDFHSCNLLHTPSGPGVIDFQDAVRGPLSYDLVSLLWDRYLTWPRERLEQWMLAAHGRLHPGCGEAEWIRHCDWMGLQRNLKIVGIFARLCYRDGKQDYLELIPRFYAYLLDVLSRYPEFRALHELLEQPECAP